MPDDRRHGRDQASREPERELALAETRAVLAAAASEEYREQLRELEEALEAGRLDEEQA